MSSAASGLVSRQSTPQPTESNRRSRHDRPVRAVQLTSVLSRNQRQLPELAAVRPQNMNGRSQSLADLPMDSAPRSLPPQRAEEVCECGLGFKQVRLRAFQCPVAVRVPSQTAVAPSPALRARCKRGSLAIDPASILYRRFSIPARGLSRIGQRHCHSVRACRRLHLLVHRRLHLFEELDPMGAG